MIDLIKKARLDQSLTQTQICKSLDIQLRTYQYIESGKHEPKIKLGLRICKFLGLNPFDVFLD